MGSFLHLKPFMKVILHKIRLAQPIILRISLFDTFDSSLILPDDGGN